MDVLEDLKMSLLNFNFVIICIIHKMLLLLKNRLDFLEDSIVDFYCFFNFFFTTYDGKSKTLRRKHTDIRDLF